MRLCTRVSQGEAATKKGRLERRGKEADTDNNNNNKESQGEEKK